MLSHDLARLYDVEAKVLVQSVKRNRERFPDDFMFQLSDEESRQRSRTVSKVPAIRLHRTRNRDVIVGLEESTMSLKRNMTANSRSFSRQFAN